MSSHLKIILTTSLLRTEPMGNTVGHPGLCECWSRCPGASQWQRGHLSPHTHPEAYTPSPQTPRLYGLKVPRYHFVSHKAEAIRKHPGLECSSSSSEFL